MIVSTDFPISRNIHSDRSHRFVILSPQNCNLAPIDRFSPLAIMQNDRGFRPRSARRISAPYPSDILLIFASLCAFFSFLFNLFGLQLHFRRKSPFAGKAHPASIRCKNFRRRERAQFYV